MILRPYQLRLKSRAIQALKERRNTLATAATGAGKTIMLAAIAGEFGGRQAVLQHRQELVQQNSSKFHKVNPGRRVSFFTADSKSWAGDTVFASQMTLARNLGTIPPLDLVVVDEAHHVAAPSYQAILNAIKDRNPDCAILGVTATPERTDKKSLRLYFDNICDRITIKELVALGFLVPPRAYVVDVSGSMEKLRALGRTSDFFDQEAVEAILNNRAINTEVVRNWKERAGDRQTVVFCATLHHAEDVCLAFREAGVTAAVVSGDMGDAKRRATLEAFDRGHVQVVVNVAVLTEGWDCQPVSCVVLLRKCSDKGPLIQMVGRGLRTVDPSLYPGVVKRDCIVLDFGSTLLTHKDLDIATDLSEPDEDKEPGDAVVKVCPADLETAGDYRFPDVNGRKGCGASVPAQTKTCPFCGFVFQKVLEEEPEATVVELTELDILNASPFRYVDVFGSGRVLMASGFSAWAGVFSPDDEVWTALGKNGTGIQKLLVGDRLQAIARADDFLREHEESDAANKKKHWLDQPATEKQVSLLNRFGYAASVDLLGRSEFTKYAACCHLDFQFNRRGIEAALGV